MHDAGVPVSPVPGLCAAAAAMSVAGIASHRFRLRDSCPLARRRAESVLHRSQGHPTLIVYEAPHRVESMADICDLFAVTVQSR